MVANACLVVGGSSEIGRELVDELKRQQGIVYVTYHRSHEWIERVTTDAVAEIVPIQTDLADSQAIGKLLARIDDKGYLPQKLVFLAAPEFKYQRFSKLTLQQFQHDWNVQVSSTFQILHNLLPKIVKKKLPAKVVAMLSSVVLDRAPNGLASYTSAKYGLLGLVKGLSAEYSGRNININALSPSYVETRYLDNIPSSMVESAAENHPKGRNAMVGDVVPSILFLLSDQANYISGVNLPIVGV